MKPKKLFHCLLLATITLLAAATTAACGNTDEAKLAADVTIANEQCPMPLEGIGNIVSIAYDSEAKVVTYTIKVDQANIVDISALCGNQKLMHRVTTWGLLQGVAEDTETSDFLTMVSKCDAGIVYVYKDPSGKEIATVKLSGDDVKKLSDKSKDKKQILDEALALQVEIMNADLPQEIDTGVRFAKVLNGEKNVVMVIEADVTAQDIQELKDSEKELKETYAQQFADGGGFADLVDPIIAAGKGLTISIVDNKGNSGIDLNYTPAELEQIKSRS